MTYAYDDAHRLRTITQGGSIVSMTYDAADRRETLTLPNGIVTTSGYDEADQVTSLTYTLGSTTLGTLTYTYDEAGNRTRVGGSWARTGLPQPLANATYDAANRIATWEGTAFSYDANGNLASDGLTSYSWNARNQLTGLSGGTAASFGYDGLGRRRTKTVGGAATSFLYDGVNAVQELAGGVSTANLLAGAIDEAFIRTDGAGMRAFLTDALGSTLALADNAGAVQTSYTYAPFGATMVSGAASANTAQFTGRENDGTGLYFYRARYHHPQLQRFIGEDPIGFGGGDVNLHAYVANQPTGVIDPHGLWLDTAIDVGSILYDLWKLATGGRKDAWTNATALGADILGAAVPLGAGFGAGVRRAAKAAKRADRTRLLPHLDATGKVHGNLPTVEDLGQYAIEELRQLQTDLRQSIQERIRRTVELGPDKAHGERIAAEQKLLRQLEKYLQDRSVKR